MKNKILFVLVSMFFTLNVIYSQSREVFNLNPGWAFSTQSSQSEAISLDFDEQGWAHVSLPHTMTYFPANLSGFRQVGRQVGWYRRSLTVSPQWKQKEVFLVFQGAMQATTLFINGKKVGNYRVSGYDSFHFDITHFIKVGENLISIEVDNRKSRDLPPDGVKRDFILFGGLYRDLKLVVTDPVYITFNWESSQAGIEVTYPSITNEQAEVAVQTELNNTSDSSLSVKLVSTLINSKGETIKTVQTKKTIAHQTKTIFNQAFDPIKNPALWSPDHPSLYTLISKVFVAEVEVDRRATRIGLRTIEWNKKKGFLLNGKKLDLVGTNRHQTWPFIGNAVPNGLHRRDAQQIKAMGMNWIRLSHYPHDPDFLDDLDELGILALAEGPTWMHRIQGKWMENLELSFRRMIRRDKNHPSIMIWNSCINHGGAEDFLVKAAHEEDPTRARGQYDVMAPMDFQHGTISTENSITIEHTGHTYPVRRGDQNLFKCSRLGRNREFNQAQRHWEMVNLSYQAPGNYGIASWCAYDYNTFHNANNQIALHGIMDLFRLPKISYAWHQSELLKKPFVSLIRKDWLQAVVFSNAMEVKLYGQMSGPFEFIAQQKPDSGFSLKHPPFSFRLKKNYTKLKAVALFANGVERELLWSDPSKATSIRLTADRKTLSADGSDISRIIIDILDSEENIIDEDGPAVKLSLAGYGALIGANPVIPTSGRQIILVQSGYQEGRLVVYAQAKGLKSSRCEVLVEPVSDNMLFPKGFDLKAPTKPDLSLFLTSHIKYEVKDSVEPFNFISVANAQPGVWVESQPVMVGGISKPVSISIKGGEYRIYTESWSGWIQKVQGGDAVTVRIKSSLNAGEKVTLTLKIGNKTGTFSVTTK